MIQQLMGHIEDWQVSRIANMILKQFFEYRKSEEAVKKMFLLEEYSPHAKRMEDTWAISSAFPSGTIVANNLRVKCLSYAGGYTRPELYNSKIILHVLGSTSSFSADYLKGYYAYNSNSFSGEKLYCYIYYKITDEKIETLKLCLPNEQGTVVSEEVLHTVIRTEAARA